MPLLHYRIDSPRPPPLFITSHPNRCGPSPSSTSASSACSSASSRRSTTSTTPRSPRPENSANEMGFVTFWVDRERIEREKQPRASRSERGVKEKERGSCQHTHQVVCPLTHTHPRTHTSTNSSTAGTTQRRGGRGRRQQSAGARTLSFLLLVGGRAGGDERQLRHAVALLVLALQRPQLPDRGVRVMVGNCRYRCRPRLSSNDASFPQLQPLLITLFPRNVI